MRTPPVVLITGALAGIGRATAFGFARTGASVVVSGRRPAEGASLVAELEQLGVSGLFVQADVRHEDEVRNLIDQTVARFGRLDIAVNNAGVEGQAGMLTDQTVENYTDIFETNVLGVILSLKYELRVMQAQGFGSIVNISSSLGRMGFAGVGVYGASKFAVEGLTRSAALEAAPFGVRVNAVAPGPVDTGMIDRLSGSEEAKAGFAQMIPVKRIGLPEEIAETIVFVASAKAPYLTGQSIAVDGGQTA